MPIIGALCSRGVKRRIENMDDPEIIEIPYAPRKPQPEIHELISQYRFSVIVAHRRLGKTVCTVNQLIKAALLDTSGNGRYGYIAPYRS